MAKKYDAVVEAVHLNGDGTIEWVRVYERMGPVYSDRLIWDRSKLVQRLKKKGASIYTGKRVILMGNSFDIGEQVRLVDKDGRDAIVVGDAQSDKDNMDSVPRV